MTGVTNPLHALTCGNPAPVLQRYPARRPDLGCYRVTGRRLRRAWQRCLDTGLALAVRAANRDHPLAEDCTNLDCPRFPCRMYHSGYQAGYRKGFADGYAQGEAAGYADGYAKGYAARPPLIVHVPIAVK